MTRRRNRHVFPFTVHFDAVPLGIWIGITASTLALIFILCGVSS